MSATQQQLDHFHAFATGKLNNGGADLSFAELFDLWQLENPTLSEREQVNAIIRQGIADIDAGRGRRADDVMNEFCSKYDLPQ